MKKFLGFLVVVLAVAGGAYWYVGQQKAAPAVAGQAAMAGGAMPVPALKVTEQKLALSQDLPGRLSAAKTGEIRPQVDGIITKRFFEEGSTVKQGQQLYQIDPKPYAAAYESAVAEMKKAEAVAKSVKAQADRYTKLLEVEAVSQQEYDDVVAALTEAEASIAVAQAAVNIAQVNMDYTKVYAPISGQIGKSYVTEGALVTANQTTPLAQVTQLEPIYADLIMPSKGLLALRQQLSDTGANVVLASEDGKTQYPHTGKLQFAEVQVDETTGSVLLRALFPNPDQHLLPGMFVRATIKLPEQNVILVPQQAAQRQQDGSLAVWKVADDGVVSVLPIQVQEKSIQGQWVVMNGLQAGDVILTSGFQKVKPGAKVSPQFEGAAAAKTEKAAH